MHSSGKREVWPSVTSNAMATRMSASIVQMGNIDRLLERWLKTGFIGLPHSRPGEDWSCGRGLDHDGHIEHERVEHERVARNGHPRHHRKMGLVRCAGDR